MGVRSIPLATLGVHKYESIGRRRNGGQMGNRGSGRFGNANGEMELIHVGFQRTFPRRTLSSRSEIRSSRVHNDGESDDGGFQNGGNHESEIYGLSSQYRINHRVSRTSSNRNKSNNTWIHNSIDEEGEA
ncbi:unnamed protein product [Linum trigynum]|uniref:Uncharacterized protein n=1 Tax=Linum trigynum TaxID=586398 RepID=A0AAV2DZT4_9ROSI